MKKFIIAGLVVLGVIIASIGLGSSVATEQTLYDPKALTTVP